MSNILKNIFLNDFHKNYGAKFIPFAGYSMPISYSEGIIKEHLYTRELVGIFDVSHMGQILIPNTSYNRNQLEWLIPLDLDNLKLKNSAYSFILNQNGGIIDDIIISKLIINKSEYFFIVYNASRKNIDEKILIANTHDHILLTNHSLLAIQGPLSSEIVNNYSKIIQKMSFMQINTFDYNNHTIIISRTGYTGEDGFELSIPNKIVYEFISDLIDHKDIHLCGLGCRDSLRLEAGLCLYGNELNENLTPVQANLFWTISKSRLISRNFNGFDKIVKQKNNGLYPKRVGIKSKSKSILRSNMNLFNENNQNIGRITSGGFSPILKTSIAIAYINNSFQENLKKIYCEIRNQFDEVELAKLPFIKHNYKRG